MFRLGLGQGWNLTFEPLVIKKIRTFGSYNIRHIRACAVLASIGNCFS